jgi:hypothetical protein
MAVLSITNEAVRVQPLERHQNVLVTFPANHPDGTYAFSKDIPAQHGCQILSAQIAPGTADAAVKDAKLTVAADHSKVTLTGKLVKSGGLLRRNTPLPVWVPEVVLKEVRRWTPEAHPPMTLATQLPLPGSVTVQLPRLPASWELQKRKIALKLFDGERSTLVPPNGQVNLRDHTWRVMATEIGGDRVQLNVTQVSPVSAPVGN